MPNVDKYKKNNYNLRCLCMHCENCLISSLSLLVKSEEVDVQLSIDHMDTARS